MRIAIDVDGTIAALRKGDESYRDVQPLPGAPEKIRALKVAGHYIILLTARHMKTCQGNVGLVVARQGRTLLDWLDLHGIPYDEIWFGKPHADIYIDDNGFRFGRWSDIKDDGNNLPSSHETASNAIQPDLK
jgi:capsule biosynthesis phosphatase